MVVGIGASAGGLEALQDFFKNMPPKTGISFVVIQHLSPDYKSYMNELLSRYTTMPVQIATNGIEVKPDNIYLIPPRKNITIFHNKLYLEDQSNKKGLNLPVDIFFRSLAQEKGKNSIGIILSGTGSDGTLGAKAIKEAGGMIMVQDEQTAKFDGMPKNAISTGLVDYILSPDKMPEALINFLKHPFLNKKIEQNLPDNFDSLTKIIIILRDYSGIDFSFYKENTILRRLERRISINRFNSLEEYLVLLSESEKEKEILNRELLIGVTSFFRDNEAFESLKKKVIPEICKKNNIRIWSVGCSTGEEAYSIAMLISEYLENNKINAEVKIFATDIDRSSIDFASKGFYPESIVADIDINYLTKYFTKYENGYQVNEIIRRNIVFATHNILKDSPFSKIDLLICRNLFIYLKPEAQARLLNMFYYSINPDGYLFMGSSETIGDMGNAFQCIDPKWKIYKFISGYQPKTNINIIKNFADMKMQNRDIISINTMRPKYIESLKFEKMLEYLVSLYLPPSVIIDNNDNILHIINDISKFVKLHPGRFSQNLFNNLDNELGLFVSALLRKLKNENNENNNSVVSITYFDKEKIKIEARTLLIDKTKFYLISFISITTNEESNNNIEIFKIDNNQYNRIEELEKELQLTKENLQATIEELETSNEELQSTNEELIASNEELQSSNEELQSVNEELYTVNSEYQIKIDELTKLNNDMNNLLRNTEIGALYLDRKLCIRKITPIVSKITNIIQSDIGRPITHISLKNIDNTLIDDIEKVTDTLQPIDKEITTKDNITYLTRIRPYRTDYNAVDGILITFVDISVLKNLENEYNKNKELFMKIIENSPNAKVLLDKDGNIIYANKKAEEIFCLTKEQISKRNYSSEDWYIEDLEGKPIDPENLPFSIVKNTKKILNNYKHYIKVKEKDKILLNISGYPLLNNNDEFEGAVFTINIINN